jgi:hypothetical protein
MRWCADCYSRQKNFPSNSNLQILNVKEYQIFQFSSPTFFVEISRTNKKTCSHVHITFPWLSAKIA